MKITRFEDAQVWQKSQELTLLLYQAFHECKDFSFRDQLLRALISISNNIAEGFDRETDKELVRYLYYAKGSTAEVRSMLYLAKSLNYLDDLIYAQANDLSNEISKMLHGFIHKLTDKSQHL